MSKSGLTIYGARFSRAHRCIWLAQELGLPFEHADIPFSDPVLKEEDYLGKNPMGKVPAIDDAGFHLWESMAINFYLAGKQPTALWPDDAKIRARVMQWTFWAVSEVEASAIALGMNSGLLPPERRSQDAIDQARAKLARPFGVLEGALASSDYLVGHTFTLADLNVAAIMWSIYGGKAPLPDHPRIQAWLHRCLSRPAAQGAFGQPAW